MLLLLIALILIAWLAIQTAPVQNWLVKKVTNKLSKDLNTVVKVGRVDFSLFNKLHLEQTLIKDRQNDTLLYAGELSADLTDWFFFKDKTVLHHIGLKDASIRLTRNDSIWNYRFLIDYFGGGKKSANAKPIELGLEKITLSNVELIQKDAWIGEDQTIRIGSLNLSADEFDMVSKKIHVKSIELDKPFFSLHNYKGNRGPRVSKKRQQIVNDPAHLRWNKDGWSIEIDEVSLKNGTFQTSRQNAIVSNNYFDGDNILFSSINGLFTKVKFINDSITVNADLSTQERSGFSVTNLKSNIRFHPEAMEFNQLELKTPKSQLHQKFAMRYESFDDLGDFITKVRMEGNFDNAVISSDDIAYFAPALKDFKSIIRVDGTITGTVDNLQAKNLIVEAGNNTYLNGNIKISGLPDIEKAFIDFDANNFRTTYADAVNLVPQLKDINQPRLDLLQYIRFKGNFTGFIKDFVTYGSIETALGTVITDVNMKFPSKGNTRYSGNLQTKNFDLGRFIKVPEIGNISFNGKINGNGLQTNSVNADLDGFVNQITVNGYSYQNITVKGNLSKKLFNGRLVSNDPNLDASLNGLVDFSSKVPKFDFEANIAKADLKKINLSKENIEFNGKFRFDFLGDNIDNFLGTARVFDANLIRNGNRISFDSLNLESKIMDSNKVITLVSNEFDAALAGEFSILDLPTAFQNFLNKYYPAYIKPTKAVSSKEDFSFVITTKNIQEYLDLFVKDIKGFDNSTITGRINNKENLLDLNAEIPNFAYKNISLYNLSLKGQGSLDSLSVATTIGDVYINDSLHFPSTSIAISSSNDQSNVRVITSANQTLNSANISALVNTRRDGVSIKFKESSFDINGKSWTIDKDGELVLSKELIAADGVKIYNGQQEIRIASVPSDIANTNDIKIDLQKINIGDFAPYVVSSNRLEGLLTGTVDIIDPFGKLQVDINGNAEQFRLDDDSVGKINLAANYNQKTGLVNFKGISENKDYQFDLKGIYNIIDSASGKQLDIVTNLNSTRINLLKRYLNTVFSEVDGFATGQLRIVGTGNNLNYLGNVALKEGKLTVAYTNVTYTIPEANIDFKDGLIDFGNILLKDSLNNVGMLTRGKLRHKSFNDLDFDFSLFSNKLLVLNTNSLTKDVFYGTVIAKANMNFSGPMEDMVMNIKGEPADSSELSIRSGSSRESGEASFLVWKIYGREMELIRPDKGSKLTVNLDINTNNLAKMNVIIDELTNDVMSARGHGNLKIQANTAGQFTMTGQYDIDRGSYDFKFQSLLRKPFTIRSGSNIRWSGDPLAAELNVTAEFVANSVKFSDLGDQLYAQGGDVEYIKKFRGEVIVIAKITDDLMKPKIDFELEMPDRQMRNDPIVVNLLRDIQADKNELNKQVAFLILFNSFGPRSTASQSSIGALAWQGIVTNSISGYVSSALNRQFSNIVKKIFNDESIKVNFNAQLYNGSNLLSNSTTSGLGVDRTNVNFSLAKSVFNERLTFTFGSALDFGLTAAQARATSSFQFLPDIAAELKLRPDGRLLLTFFYRDSYNFQSASGKQNRSGAGISYRRDFDKFGDLFRSDRKKKKAAVVSGPVSSTD